MPKPQLAVDWRKDKLRFPAIAQPKLDGVRGGQFMPGLFSARTLKPFKNKRLTKFYNDSVLYGLDGELVIPNVAWNYSAMCRETTSVINTVHSTQLLDLVCFDFVTEKTMHLGYAKRYDLLTRQLEKLKKLEYSTLHQMPCVVVKNMEELLCQDSIWLADDYEGTIIRHPDEPVKEGRSGNSMELWRIKRFIDFEVVVTELAEAMENRNEAKVNELGHTERSTHKANKYGKNMVGMVRGRVLKDVVYDGELLFRKGMSIDIGPGKMDHPTRSLYWKNPELIISKVGKVKTFPRGVMDKPRMPTWLSLRAEEDM